MFGTIGHARCKPGRRAQIDALTSEWQQTIRPQVPGAFIQLVGNRDGHPDELVFVVLAQDKATYKALAAMPEQDAWYHHFAESVDGEVRWEDVEMKTVGD